MSVSRLASTWWFQHLGLVVGFASVVLISLRLLSVSYFDVTTAKVLLQESGAASIAVGTMLHSIPLVTVYALLAFSIRFSSPSSHELGIVHRGVASQFNRKLSYGFAVIVAIILLPVLHLVFAIILVLLHTIAQWTNKKKLNRRLTRLYEKEKLKDEPAEVHSLQEAIHQLELAESGSQTGHPGQSEIADERTRLEAEVTAFSATVRSFFALAVLGVSVTFLSDTSPWMASENVRLKGRPPATAYMVSNSGTEVVLLMDTPRKIVRIDSHQLVSRKACQPESSLLSTGTIFVVRDALNSVDRYPTCPSS